MTTASYIQRLGSLVDKTMKAAPRKNVFPWEDNGLTGESIGFGGPLDPAKDVVHTLIQKGVRPGGASPYLHISVSTKHNHGLTCATVSVDGKWSFETRNMPDFSTPEKFLNILESIDFVW